MRDAVRAVHKEFFLGSTHPAQLDASVGGAGLKGSRPPDDPMATATYGGGGGRRFRTTGARRWRSKGSTAYYCGGMLLRMYSAANLAAHMTARRREDERLLALHRAHPLHPPGAAAG